MELKKAYELALLKWQMIIDNDGETPVDLFNAHEDLSKLKSKSYCSYCALYFDTTTNCAGCPIRIRPVCRMDFYCSSCNVNGHPFSLWRTKKDRETAQAVLDFIIEHKPEF